MINYKMIDLKIDLICLNEEEKYIFAEKYSKNIQEILCKLSVLVFLDDFLYIDNKLCDNFLTAIEILRESEKKYNYSFLIENINHIKEDESSEKNSRRDESIRTFYKELNIYLMNNNLSFEELTDIYEAIRKMDDLYQNHKLRNSSVMSVINLLNNLAYKLVLFDTKNKVSNLIHVKKNQSDYQKIKK